MLTLARTNDNGGQLALRPSTWPVAAFRTPAAACRPAWGADLRQACVGTRSTARHCCWRGRPPAAAASPAPPRARTWTCGWSSSLSRRSQARDARCCHPAAARVGRRRSAALACCALVRLRRRRPEHRHRHALRGVPAQVSAEQAARTTPQPSPAPGPITTPESAQYTGGGGGGTGAACWASAMRATG